MRLLTFILIVVVISLYACAEDEPAAPTIIVVAPLGPQLPKIDCERRLQRLVTDMAARGILQTGMAEEAYAEEERKCAEENKRRGY